MAYDKEVSTEHLPLRSSMAPFTFVEARLMLCSRLHTVIDVDRFGRFQPDRG